MNKKLEEKIKIRMIISHIIGTILMSISIFVHHPLLIFGMYISLLYSGIHIGFLYNK